MYYTCIIWYILWIILRIYIYICVEIYGIAFITFSLATTPAQPSPPGGRTRGDMQEAPAATELDPWVRSTETNSPAQRLSTRYAETMEDIWKKKMMMMTTTMMMMNDDELDNVPEKEMFEDSLLPDITRRSCTSSDESETFRGGITLRMANSPTFQPIGSMYAIYGNIYHQYTPVMLAYNYTSTTDAMGYGKHIKTVDHFPRETTACRSLITVTLYTGGLEDGNISNCLLAVIV